EQSALANGVVVLDGTTVTNSYLNVATPTNGTVQVADANSVLDLIGSEIDGGNIDNSGTFKATGGTNLISAATDITNAGTLKVVGDGVVLTIDSASAFTNQGTLLATSKGELDLINDVINNTNGTVQTIGSQSIIDLQGTTFSKGNFDIAGVLQATVGGAGID